MSASMSTFRLKKKIKRSRQISRNAKFNQAINGGRTAARVFYQYWSY
nr:MAG TPA: hypothetical protein [Caudoviricetes sp.]DAS55036.1 MAG TPA: hypothetical protein [Caudoviricetes sp.]